MKISNKQTKQKKEIKIQSRHNNSKIMSRSLTKVKQINHGLIHSPTKKGKQLQVIKQKNQTPKKKKQQKIQKKKKINYCLNLKQLKPVNLQKEKEIFFNNNCKYDPFFIYPNISDLTDEEYKDMRKYQNAQQTYLNLAVQILQKSIEIGMDKLLKASQLLTQEETSFAFDQYIARLDIGNLLTYQFVQNTIAPTSVVHNNQECMSRVLIGMPINYRKNTIQGVLNHEIGTHFLRKYNDRAQKWFKDRKKFNLGPYLQTEQGLAALNQLCSYVMQDTVPPLLYKPALLYYSCYLASKTSFSKLYESIAKYQPDPEYRWKQCVRVKRGIADTSKPHGKLKITVGMYKDQIYFSGAIQILKNRNDLNFYHLYSGKISVQDCLRLSAKGIIQQQKLKIPHFLANMKLYRRCLDLIAQTNLVDIK